MVETGSAPTVGCTSMDEQGEPWEVSEHSSPFLSTPNSYGFYTEILVYRNMKLLCFLLF